MCYLFTDNEYTTLEELSNRVEQSLWVFSKRPYKRGKSLNHRTCFFPSALPLPQPTPSPHKHKRSRQPRTLHKQQPTPAKAIDTTTTTKLSPLHHDECESYIQQPRHYFIALSKLYTKSTFRHDAFQSIQHTTSAPQYRQPSIRLGTPLTSGLMFKLHNPYSTY